MQIGKNKGFTLVELLVVITILAIISVVAYQNFGGAVDKAVSGRKIADVSTIETSLQQYRTENNYYPPVGEYDASTNMWGYTGSFVASKSNKIQVTYNGQEIESLLTGTGGGRVYGSGTISGTVNGQIGAKGTIGKDQLNKFLTKDLYDPELGDIVVNNIDGSGTKGKMIDKGVGRYVYAVYKKSFNWDNNQNGVSYNIAYTIKKGGDEEGYVTKIVGDYDKANYGDLTTHPETLIGTLSGSTINEVLKDGTPQNGASSSNDYGVPYAVNDFAK